MELPLKGENPSICWDAIEGCLHSVPCSCGQCYVGETVCRLETRIAEHKEACMLQGQTGEIRNRALARAWRGQ